MNDRATVLFVDDDEQIVNLLRMLFRLEYNVLTATSGAAALELLHQHRVHVLVSDQRMPGMTGIEVLKQARALAPATMRILLTGYSDMAAIVGSVNEGEVYRFVNKPWKNAELRAVIAEAAHAARATFTALKDGQPPTLGPATPATAAPGPATLRPATLRPGTLTGNSVIGEAHGALLVVDEDPRVPQWFREHFGAAYPVLEAASVAEAMGRLETQDIAVIVTGEKVAGQSTLPLLRALKQRYPMIMTVMLTSTQDADLVVRLINEVKVCRVLFRPIKAGAVELALRAAMKLHTAHLAEPALWHRERVVERAAEPDDAGLPASWFERMRARFGRFAHFAGRPA